MTMTLREQQQAAGAHFEPAGNQGPALVAHYGDPAREYQAALERAACVDMSHAGRIWLHDRDRAALLHRLSTNDIEGLSPGQGCQTVLTNHNGRIIDLLSVYALPDQLLIVTSPQQHGRVSALLRKNIFFNDRVRLEDAGETTGQLMLYGPDSARCLADLGAAAIAELPLHGVVAVEVNGVSLWVARVRPLGGAGFALFAPAGQLADLWAALVAAGVQPLGQAAFDCLRVEAGYPAPGHELSLEYIPLETGLWDAVSFHKGCYVGQEIIARMESRGRVAKQLRGLVLSGLVDPPRKLQLDGKEVGDLTSVVQSPRFGTIGLAYVRTAHAEPGTQVDIAESSVTGAVQALSFS